MISPSDNGFVPLPLHDGLLLDRGALRVYGWGGMRTLTGGTCFGMVTAGRPTLMVGEDIFTLRSKMFFVEPCDFSIIGGQGLLIHLAGYQGLRQLGGPIEPVGRLRYIDGCTDTLLVCPPRLGEPCFNHLHIPAHTAQSAHTHPSDRIGVIAGGEGWCVTSAGRFPLSPGMGWWIPAGTRHCFHTETSALDVLAWHPDSDFGPTDEDHPMLNRTILP